MGLPVGGLRVPVAHLSLRRPDAALEQRAVAAGLRLGHAYAEVGASRHDCPPAPAGYVLDHGRVLVGRGAEDYREARELLERWGHFQLGWTYVRPDTPVREGAGVCVAARLGLWVRNPLRVVYVDESTGEGLKKRFAYAHGCLDTHMLAGEERFAVEWDAEDDGVYYSNLAFSRPSHPLAYALYPVVRVCQAKFGADSRGAVKRALEHRRRARQAPSER